MLRPMGDLGGWGVRLNPVADLTSVTQTTEMPQGSAQGTSGLSPLGGLRWLPALVLILWVSASPSRASMSQITLWGRTFKSLKGREREREREMVKILNFPLSGAGSWSPEH